MWKKHMILLIGILILLGQYSITHADTIYFKDGRIVETRGCWEENGQIKYEKYGATIGVNKNDILKIVHDSWEDVGHKYFKDGKYKKASDCFTEAITDSPTNTELYIGRAKCWHKLKNTEAEIKDLKKASELDPKNKSVRAELTVLLEKEKVKRKFQDSLLKTKNISDRASNNRSGYKSIRRNTKYKNKPDYEIINRRSTGPQRVKVACKACKGSGRLTSWRWEKTIVGYDSYNNPIKVDKQVPTTKTCYICNGIGYTFQTIHR